MNKPLKICYLILSVFWQLLSKFNFWKADWALGCLSTQIWHFFNISQFRKILSLKSFGNFSGNSWGNSFTKFVILDVKYRFTCGDSDLCLIIEKCQNIMTRIVWKLFFYSLHFQWWFNYLEKVPILAQKC